MSAKRGLATEEGMGAIGERLARLRKARGITQIEMASRLGTTQSIISQYERGEFRLHAELVSRLAEILDVSADELLGIEHRKKKTPQPSLTTQDMRLLRRVQVINKLPRRDRDALLRTIDGFLKARSG